MTEDTIDHDLKLKDFVVAALEEKKADNITVIDIKERTDMAKYIILASGRSVKNISSMAEFLALELKHKLKINSTIEGASGSEWVLIDIKNIIVHIFNSGARELYKLEEIWR